MAEDVQGTAKVDQSVANNREEFERIAATLGICAFPKKFAIVL